MQRETIKAYGDKSQINYNRKNNSGTNAILSSKSWFFVPKWPTWRPFGIETHDSSCTVWTASSTPNHHVTVLKSTANQGGSPQPQCPEFSLEASLFMHDLLKHRLHCWIQSPDPSLPRLPGSKPQSSNHMVGISGMDSPIWVISLAQII